MKKSILLAFVAMLGFTAQVSAQITEGEPTARKIRTGNRMEKGDWGLFMGITSDMFKNWKDASIKNDISLPLLNVKYMYSDRIEARMGFEVYKTRTTVKGEEVDLTATTPYNTDGSINATVDSKDKNIKSSARMIPGIAYHFSKNNILDVYAGAELPIGWSRDVTRNNYDDAKYSLKHNSFDIGLGAFVGLQAFIGHLPVAVGFEYGLSGIAHCGNKYVEHNEVPATTLTAKQNYTYKYLYDPTDFANAGQTQYKSLKNRGTELGSQFRITISYFFK